MQHRSRHGFTLIELLVVIAIIAILAAILFPVFAQAREKARQTSCVSNEKQLATATLMYSQDYDELLPFGFGTYLGVWQTQASGVPYVGDTPPGWRSANAAWVGGMGEYWGNSIQPYTKAYAVLRCPSASTLSGLTGVQAAGQPAPVETSLTYNGLLQSYALAGINSPATVPMITENRGKGYYKGYQAPSPFLLCQPNSQPCTYVPYVSGCAASVNGQRSSWFGFIGTADVHGKGMSYAYTDGHVKFKRLSIDIVNPGRTNGNFEPFAYYNTNGTPASAWVDGCHIWYFRPDWVAP